MDYLDLFNRYIMGGVQIFLSFYFYIRFLKRHIKPICYPLFILLGIAVMERAEAGTMPAFLLYILLLCSSGFFLCGVRNRSVVLYAVTTTVTMQFLFGIFHSLLCILYPLAAAFPQKPVGILFMLLGYLSLPATFFCYRITEKFFLYEETINGQSVLLALIPTLMIFFIGCYIHSTIYGNTITTNHNRIMLPANQYQLLTIQLLGMTSLFCTMLSYKKLLENFRLHTRLSLLVQEEHSLQQYVAEAKSRYEKTRSFRHDIKNHIIVLQKLLQEEKGKEAAAYLNDMEKAAEELSFSCNTNNPVADILIGNKFGMAESMGIAVSCSLQLPYPCSIRDIDFAVIFANALDNAISACNSMETHEQKYIRIAGKMQGDFIMLEIENSCRKGTLCKKGTGLMNIQTVAEKYQGVMNINLQDTVFTLHVLLVIPQHTESISQQTH